MWPQEGSECPLSCNVFSERLRLYRVSWGCEKPLLTKAARALWRDEKKTQQSLRGPWLLQSVAVTVSKPQLHEKVSSEDLAVAGHVPLPAFFWAACSMWKMDMEKCSENITMEIPPWSLNPVPNHHRPQSITFLNFNVFLCKWARDLCSKLTDRLYLCFPVHSNFKFPCLIYNLPIQKIIISTKNHLLAPQDDVC